MKIVVLNGAKVNFDMEACHAWGIGVCNVPTYSPERVAHTAVMLMLASSMQKQISMLAKGDHTNFDMNMLLI